MNMELVVVGSSLAYICFGLLLMDFMCPCWHPFEKLIGAIIWPISAVIGIVLSIREAKHGSRMGDDLLVLQIRLITIMLEEAVRKEAHDQKAPKGQAPGDEHSKAD